MRIFTSKFRVLLVFAFLLVFGLKANADVTITMPTGGQNLSADRSLNGPLQQYSALGDIVISDNIAGDFTNGSGRTIIITAPTNWRFQAGIGSVLRSGSNLTAASVSITTTTITVTYTAAGALAAGNSLTISGIVVRSITGAVGTPENATRTGGTGVIAGFTTGAVVATLSKVPGAFSQLQTLFPGNTSNPGSATGRAGTATTQTSGIAFPVTVNAVDWAFNLVPSAPADEVQITSSDVNATLPANNTLSGGTQTFNITLKAAGTAKTVTATDVTDGTKTANTSGSVTVAAGAYTKLQVILPGETAAPGTVSGVTGTPTTRTAGTAFSVRVNAVDANWNVVTSVTNTVKVSSTDAIGTNPANKALAAGTTTFNVTLRQAGTLNTITATTVPAGAITPYTTVAVPVNAGTFTKLQILLPGEVAAPGTSATGTGKTAATPTPQVAGTPISVTVNAVDANWNIVTTVNDVVGITNATYTNVTTLPPNAALSGGTGTFSVALNRVGAQKLKATDITDAAKTASTSGSVTITVGAFSKLQILLAGETAAPGTPTGKTGTPTDRSAGLAANVTVNAVDAFWNRVTGITDVVTITSSDPNATLPANAALSNGTKTNFSVNLKTVGLQTITATDFTDPAKTANVSASVNVVAGAFVKLQILLPGETAAPATTSGKTGTPTPQAAGSIIAVTVNAVDVAWNVVSTITDAVKITSSDVNAVLPANNTLVAGTRTFNVTLKTAGSRTITASDATDGTKTANTSATVVVTAGAYASLLVLLPGEAIAPGTATGSTGNPSIPARNTQFQIKIYPVDAYYNIVSGVTNTVNLTKSDVAATVPTSTTLVNGAVRNLNVTIRTAGIQTISLTDASTAFNTVVSISDPTPLSVITDFFRSVDSGNWNDAATWESSTNGSTAWHAATLTPTNASSAISIQNTHVVTVTASVTVDEVTVQTGGQLNVNAGTLSVVDDAGLPNELIVAGTLRASSAITFAATASTLFTATGKYQHNFTTTTGSIPIAVWTAGSVCEIVGYTTYTGAVDGSQQAFSDFIWNCPNQNVAGNGPSLQITFLARDLTVVSTGTGIFYLSSSTTDRIISAQRNYSQVSGNVGLTKSTGALQFNIGGNFTLLGGTLQRGAAGGSITFTATSAQIFTKTGGTISGAIDFTIRNNAIVDFGTSVLDGTSGVFTLAAGGTIITGNDNGLASAGTNSGSIQNTGTRTFGAANYTYNGSNAQLAGTGLPLSVANLTINNSQGVTLPSTSATYSISGALTLTSGSLDMRTNVLSGAFTNTGSGTLITQAATPFATGKTWAVGVTYNSASAQNLISGTYNRSLTLSEAGTKLGPSGAFTVAGTWSSDDGKVDLLTNNTPLVFNGTNQSISDLGSDSGNGLLFKTVTFSGGSAITLSTGSFSLASNGILTMSGTTTFNANGNLTLVSDPTTSATIAAIPSGASITGAVIAQRYISGGTMSPYRTYRMLSSPVYDNSTSLINNDSPGNRKYSMTQFIDDMIITGSGGATNGFDATAGNTATAFLYNSGAFVPVTNINTDINVGGGAYIFYRGNRNNFEDKTTSPFVDPENIVMDFKGILNQQNITVPLGTGFNLVGNPYASTIDWNAGSFVKSNMDNVIRVWNPASRQYATFDGTNGTLGGSRFIASGQAFFVEASNAAGSLTFTENVKNGSTGTTAILSAPNAGGESVAAVVPTTVRVKMKKDLTSNVDETLVVLTAGKTAAYLKGEDVVHLNGEQVFLSSLSTDDKKLVINYMPQIENVAVIKLNVEATSSGNYHLDFNMVDVPSGYTIQLKDNYLNTISDVTNTTSYPLVIDKTITASFGSDRIILLVNPPVTLPVTLTEVAVNKVTEGVAVKWTTASETNNKHFEIARAGENGSFTNIGTVLAKGPSNYLFLDKTPLIGNNYYNLIQVDNDGTKHTYGPYVVKYDLNAVSTAVLSIFPNPVIDQFTVKYAGSLATAKHIVKIVSPVGQTLATKIVSGEELSNGYSMSASTYPTGVYIIEVYDATTNKKVGFLKMIKQ